MRVSLFALALVVATCAAPTALASRATLTLETTEGPVEAGRAVPVTIHLAVEDFMCHEPRDFVVALEAAPSAGVTAKLESDNVTLPVPAHAYFSETYRASGTVNLTVLGDGAGEVNLTATFEAERGPCFVPGGFAPTSASLVVQVVPAQAPAEEPEPAPPAEEHPEADEPQPAGPDANETTKTPASPSTAPEPKPEPVRGEDCDGVRCGYIGDFVPPESESRHETPLPGAALVVAALGALALARRKR